MHMPGCSPREMLHLRNSLDSMLSLSSTISMTLLPNPRLLVGCGRLGRSRSKCHAHVPISRHFLLRQMPQILRCLVSGIDPWSTFWSQRFKTLLHQDHSYIHPSPSGGACPGVFQNLSKYTVKPIALTSQCNSSKRPRKYHHPQIIPRLRV